MEKVNKLLETLNVISYIVFKVTENCESLGKTKLIVNSNIDFIFKFFHSQRKLDETDTKKKMTEEKIHLM